MKKILIVFGTRPEAIKMAPVVMELRRRQHAFVTKVCVTAQHRQMLDQVLEHFHIHPDFDLDVMIENQDLFQVTSKILLGMKDVLAQEHPDLVIVHGDTTTTFAASLAAYYMQIPVAHVEAGLRTHNRYSPFPEEINRRLTSALTIYHFAPTQRARDNLVAEGILDEQIHVTGNTVIDALLFVHKQVKQAPPELGELKGINLDDSPLMLVTGHRRENFEGGLVNVCEAIGRLAKDFPNLKIVFPVHLNPNVRGVVTNALKGMQNVFLIEPLSYLPFVYLMGKATLILTDSGGIQEEAPALGKPVLVTRSCTERPEGVDAGVTEVVGTDTEQVYAAVARLLTDPEEYQKMACASNPYGDGHAAVRIADILENLEMVTRVGR